MKADGIGVTRLTYDQIRETAAGLAAGRRHYAHGMDDRPEKKRLTPAEVKAREERLRAAGITVGRQSTSVITLLTKRTPVEGPREDNDGSGAAVQ